jgi:hypothetical protein
VAKPKHALRALRLRCAEPQELMKKSATSDSCLANTSRSPVNSKILEVFRVSTTTSLRSGKNLTCTTSYGVC